MAYIFHNTNLGHPPIASTGLASDTAGRSRPGPWPGDIATAEDPVYRTGEFILLKGVADTVVGSWVTYNLDDWGTTLLAANAIGPVAVAMSANVASQWGWYCIHGKVQAQAATNFADNGNVYATATAGVVDDAIVAGDLVKRAKGASTITTAGLADFEIARPFMDDGLTA